MFVPEFAQIVKPLQQMVKQSVQFKWTDVGKVSFNDIKAAIAHAPCNSLVLTPFALKMYVMYIL